MRPAHDFVAADFARDEEIYAQDSAADRLYQIVQGVVRTSRVTCDGRRQVGDFYYRGEIFGLESGRQHRFAAEALCDCRVRTIGRRAGAGWVSDAEVDLLIRDAAQREMARLENHVVMLGHKGARERVACFLMSLAPRQRDGQIELLMSRQDIADYLGLTIETVSRALTQLQADRIVVFPASRQFEICKWSALEAMAA